MTDDLKIIPDGLVDQDMFNEDVSEAFPVSYHQATSKAFGLDETYIIKLALNSDQTKVLAALSNSEIVQLDALNLSKVKSVPSSCHDNSVTSIRASSTDPNVLYTSSLDGCLRIFDLRESSDKASKIFKDTSRQEGQQQQKKPYLPLKPLTAFDVNASERLLCAGSEQFGKGEAFLLFWDARKESLLGGYWDSHEDDITSVAFNPDSADRLASSGTDGIVNVFDVSKESEDDALETSINTESSVQKLLWFQRGKKGGSSSLACLTHTEELHLWDVEDFGPYAEFKREDACVAMRRKLTELSYFVDCFEKRGEEDGRQLCSLVASSCSKNPCLRLANVRKNRLKPMADFRLESKTQHVIRCSAFNDSTGVLYTGGEDGVLRLWKEGEESAGKSDLKARVEKKLKIKPY